VAPLGGTSDGLRSAPQKAYPASKRSNAFGEDRMYRMRCAIRHDGCWATNLGQSPLVDDLKFWSGVKLDRTRVMGTFILKAHEPIDVLSFNQYPLEFVDVFEEKVSDREYQYTVEYVIEDHLKNTTINVLFESGCVFEPPAQVDGMYEFHNILAPRKANFARLKALLAKHKWEFRILGVKSIHSIDNVPRVSWKKELTPRQLEAIELAFRKGFYYYPRKVHIAELAGEAHLSRSTYQEHLRLAEVKLIRSLLGTEN
jgi:predicted DNA binding protein